MDLTPIFNEFLASHESRPVEPHIFRLQDLDEFLKEAYRIVGHVAVRTRMELAANFWIASAHCRASHVPQVNTTELSFYCPPAKTKANCANANKQFAELQRCRLEILDG